MIDLISDNYSMLQGLSSFGIRLGFGDKTVDEVCSEQGVDCYTFLVVVNFLINGYAPKETDERISVKTLVGYLQASHRFFLDYQLPSIRKKLEEALSQGDNMAVLILRLYDEYDITGKFHELKSIIIQYLPQDGLTNNQLTTAIYDIYSNEEWLSNHSNVEDVLFVPAIRLLEQKVKSDDVSARISSMINSVEGTESISDREKEIIVCLVQGMSNKEIAAQLFISVNTVITHRRNISRKLQIHSLAGLTIYAIANNLIDKRCFMK